MGFLRSLGRFGARMTRWACSGIAAGGFASAAPRSDIAFGEEFKSQCTCYWCCFYQTNVHHVAQSVHGTAACADQRVAGFIVVEVLGAERADRDQAVGAGIAEFDEQAGAGDAG